MAPDNNTGGAGANWAWAALTPLLLAAAACTGIGIFFLPAFCVYLDGRSRTYAGAATLAAGTVLVTALFGAPALAVGACVILATAAATILIRTKIQFSTGLAGSAAGGVLGMVALLGILGSSLGAPLNGAAASAIAGVFARHANAGDPFPLDLFTYLIRLGGQVNLNSFTGSIPAEILSMTVDEKLAVVTGVLETTIAVLIPSFALAGGLLMGGLAYWLPNLALARRVRAASDEPSSAVPPFAAFKVPKYVVISLLLLQIVASFGASAQNIGWLTVESAADMTLRMLMVTQALALFSFFLNRKSVATGFQILIFIPAVILFSWLLNWVGLFDALFDLRAVLPKVEEVRARGKQVFTQDGLQELRKMQRDKRDDKNDKNGEDGKK